MHRANAVVVCNAAAAFRAESKPKKRPRLEFPRTMASEPGLKTNKHDCESHTMILSLSRIDSMSETQVPVKGSDAPAPAASSSSSENVLESAEHIMAKTATGCIHYEISYKQVAWPDRVRGVRYICIVISCSVLSWFLSVLKVEAGMCCTHHFYRMNCGQL
jgi:hypothetical protein